MITITELKKILVKISRKALIIGCHDSGIPGVKVDMANYKEFFQSPLGGAWQANEIVTLENPDKATVVAQLDTLKNVEYSVVVFAGHGHHPLREGPTIVQLKPGLELSSDVLKNGAPKHTLILDCCRELMPEPTMESLMAKSAAVQSQLNASDCRVYFDKTIQECSKGLVVMFACDIDETSGDSSTRGGYYSSSLINSAKEWHTCSIVDTTTNYRVLSVFDAHTRAAIDVRRISGERQNPTIDYPRVDKKFPFAVLA